MQSGRCQARPTPCQAYGYVVQLPYGSTYGLFVFYLWDNPVVTPHRALNSEQVRPYTHRSCLASWVKVPVSVMPSDAALHVAGPL
jgi:hypothetical protein